MKPALWGVLLFSLGALCSCSLHQRTATESLETLAADLTEDEDEGPRPAVDWWLSFGDDSLNRIVARALKENPTLDQAAASVRRAEAFLAGQRAADLPGVNAIGSAGRGRTQGVMGGVASSWNLSAVASYELDLWGRRAALETQRVLDREDSLAALAAAFVSVSAQASDTWYLWGERRARRELSEERVALLKERLGMIELRYGRGTVPAREVYDARGELAAEEVALSGYRADAAAAGHALAALLNQNPGHIDGAFKPPHPYSIPSLPTLAGKPLSSRLILGRPDMVRAMIQVKKADEAVAVSLADRFPSFSLTAGYGRAGYDWGSLSGSGPVWNIGGDLLAPLMDWGGRKSRVTADKAAFDEALARYRNLALSAFKEAADALSRCQTGEDAVARSQEALEAALSTAAYTHSRYLQGAADYLALLGARIAENEARGRLITQQRLLLSHRIGLARALGGSFNDTWLTAYVNKQGAQP